MGACLGKQTVLLAEVAETKPTQWTRISDVSQEAESRQSFAGLEPEPLRI